MIGLNMNMNRNMNMNMSVNVKRTRCLDGEGLLRWFGSV